MKRGNEGELEINGGKMKKVFVTAVLMIAIIVLVADSMFPVITKQAMNEPKGKAPVRNGTTRDLQFIIEPTDIIQSYYDYMPGSYNATPVQIQPEMSQPYGHSAGGLYIVFHEQETSGANRREYYCYIDSDGIIQPAAPIGVADIWEGFGGIDIDPYTADPFVSWHQQAGDSYNDEMTYDLFHILGGPGLWRETFTVIDNTVLEGGYIWPYVHIGASPFGAEYRRVFITGNNAAQDTPSGNPSENVYLGYADFTSYDLDAQSALDWTYQTIPLLDQWHNEEPWIRPFQAFTVSDDGKVCYFGYNSDDEIYVFYNDNYGEGGFEYISTPWKMYVDNPLNDDGTFAFDNGNRDPYDIYFAFVNSHHFNAIFTDDNSKIRFVGSLGLNGDDPDDPEGGVYWPYAIYPKEFIYDIENQEFSFYDLYPKGANPADENPMLPWDLDENGIVDEFDTDGSVLWVAGWPTFFYDNDQAFHDNNFKITSNENWLAAVWQDGLYAKYANEGVEGYEDWADVPEIVIVVSNDYGNTWSDPFFLNSIDTPQLADQIPCYVYPGDVLEIIDESNVKLHLFYYDDNSYGSSMYNFGLANGGLFKYASLSINTMSSTDEYTIDLDELQLRQNYPNPFSSETTISFSTSGNIEKTEIGIYNIRGQKVRTFPDIQISKSPNQQIVWDGKDENNRKVKSGIYLYKITSGNRSSTKKMIFLN